MARPGEVAAAASGSNDGMEPSSIQARSAEDLAARIDGDVIAPGDAAYDDARAIWNGMIDRRPALIARVAGTADVVAAVRFARERGIPLAVRGGGHNVAGSALEDDALVIDLSDMRAVHVDAE